jgi:HAD superfamily hydrolase (TIGR01662 family)
MTDLLEQVTVVIPTIGRDSLYALLESLGQGPAVAEVVVVDDRRSGSALPVPTLPVPTQINGAPVRTVSSGGRGPATARNRGWRAARTEWIAFLDDDVLLPPGWSAHLRQDLSSLADDCAGSQGRVDVPLPGHRRPTDWERTTAGLATSRWITADMAYCRTALQEVGGFDERFPRAYREDADLALRVMRAGRRLRLGTRRVTHPVRPVDRWVSVRAQAGNADDMLMARLHGPGWRGAADAPRGRRLRHTAVTAAAVVAVAATATRRRRLAAPAAAAWGLGTAELAAARIAPGPRDPSEITTMLLTSVLIPPVAVWHTARGLLRHRHTTPWSPAPDAVLFDRDGTLVHDVPYNGDPALVQPVAGARAALDRLRAAHVRIGVVSNQSGIGKGLVTEQQVAAVNQAIDDLLGPLDVWQVCPHDESDGCSCRKPAPGLIREACAVLAVDPARTVVVGDIGSDVLAAQSAGASGILVPTKQTRTEEIAMARRSAPGLTEAVDTILAGAW